jgi:hypothetical protein
VIKVGCATQSSVSRSPARARSRRAARVGDANAPSL